MAPGIPRATDSSSHAGSSHAYDLSSEIIHFLFPQMLKMLPARVAIGQLPGLLPRTEPASSQTDLLGFFCVIFFTSFPYHCFTSGCSGNNWNILPQYLQLTGYL